MDVFVFWFLPVSPRYLDFCVFLYRLFWPQMSYYHFATAKSLFPRSWFGSLKQSWTRGLLRIISLSSLGTTLQQSILDIALFEYGFPRAISFRKSPKRALGAVLGRTLVRECSEDCGNFRWSEAGSERQSPERVLLEQYMRKESIPDP